MDKRETQPSSRQEKNQRFGEIVLRLGEIDRQITVLQNEKEELIPELQALKESGASIDGYVEPDPDWHVNRFN